MACRPRWSCAAHPRPASTTPRAASMMPCAPRWPRSLGARMRRRPAILVALLAIAALFARGALRTRRAIARISNLEDETVTNDAGAVKSVQSADVILPRAELDTLWSPENL